MSDNATERPQPLRIGHVAGVTLTKFRRLWDERFAQGLEVVDIEDAEQVAAVRDGLVDMCFVRLPIDQNSLHAIPLYDDVLVAWVSKDHPVAAFDEVTLAELADETVLTELDTVAIDRVLAGAVLIVPMSIARSASRRDLVHRLVTDAEPSHVALAWRVDNDHPMIDEFIGVVRGRTPNSSRTIGERSAKPSSTQATRSTAQRRRTRRHTR